MITIEFLQSKHLTHFSGWSKEVHTVRAGSGNVEILNGCIIRFTEYNFLPVDGRTLDGHYEFYVNINTFKYLVRQESYYGSLSYTTPTQEQGWKKLCKKDVEYVEALIAHKLLGIYFYDDNAINSNGKNLFSDGTPSKSAGNGYNPNIVRWEDGRKQSLVSSMGFAHDMDAEAVNKLDFKKKKIKRKRKNEITLS